MFPAQLIQGCPVQSAGCYRRKSHVNIDKSRMRFRSRAAACRSCRRKAPRPALWRWQQGLRRGECRASRPRGCWPDAGQSRTHGRRVQRARDSHPIVAAWRHQQADVGSWRRLLALIGRPQEPTPGADAPGDAGPAQVRSPFRHLSPAPESVAKGPLSSKQSPTPAAVLVVLPRPHWTLVIYLSRTGLKCDASHRQDKKPLA
jgi:hypothetical protein